MKRVFVVHRWEGGPHDDWRPWLKSELETAGYEVVIPAMPGTESPVIEKWVDHLAGVVGEADADTYFVGHSIGCQTILRYLENCTKPVGGAIFVSGWFHLEHLEDAGTKDIAKPWLTVPIDLEKVKRVLRKSLLIISDNDPYGAFEENKRKFSQLGSEIIVLHHAGHMTKADGFTTLSQVIEYLKKISQ